MTDEQIRKAYAETRAEENTLVQSLKNVMENLEVSLDKAMALLNVPND